MASLTALFSSSKANCTLLSSSYGNILIDCGASLKATSQSLSSLGSEIELIKAVLITHEHSDHIKGLKALTSKYKIPVYSSSKTLETLINCNAVDKNALLFNTENNSFINDIKIERFKTEHDSVDSGGFRITLPDGNIVCICTDLGIVTDTVRKALNGATAVLLESNHDVRMLQNGPYPPELKLRIAGDKGHISNNTCAAELKRLLQNGTNRFMLGHLSENNNTPLLARSAAENALMDIGAKNSYDYTLKVAKAAGNETLFF